METNKELIEFLKVGIGIVLDNLQCMEVGIADKFQHLEHTLTHLSNIILNNCEVATSPHQVSPLESWPIVSSKTVKLEFPIFTSDDPTKSLSLVYQFFDFQNTLMTKKVTMALYYLEGEANQWL